MNELNKTKFQIIIDKQPKGLWSFGICISSFHDETYIYLNLFKISISIGKLYIETKNNNNDATIEKMVNKNEL